MVVWLFLKKWWLAVAGLLGALLLLDSRARRERALREGKEEEKRKADAALMATVRAANAASAARAVEMIASGNYRNEVKVIEEKFAEKQAVIEEKKAALPSTNASAEEVADAWNKRLGG